MTTPPDDRSTPRASKSADPAELGYEDDSILAVRIIGESKQLESFDSLGYDVGLYHQGNCARRGERQFQRIFEIDDRVMAFELDWTDLPDCDYCHNRIPKESTP